MEKTYEFYSFGNGGKSIIKLSNNTLTISRPGLLSKMALGFTGEKTIMLNQISAIQVKKVGISKGYIQFIMAGTKEARSGSVLGQNDENIIYHDGSSIKRIKQANADFEEIKNYIESYNSQVNSTTLNIKSPIEQIKDLKDLLDVGAITQEEFEKKKAELLGL